jgi:Flagellar biosynthesis/type III secretory pathway protein
MNSSRIFKQDSLFTPTPLVRRTIPRPKDKESPATEANFPDEPAIQVGSEPEYPPEIRDEPPPEQMPEPESTPAIDFEAIRQEAYNRGMADLSTQFRTELRLAVAAFNDGCQKIDKQRQAMFQHNRTELINLIILLSEKILHRELASPRNVIAATLEKALEQAIASTEYTVTLHPDDLAVAEAKAPELIASIRGLSRLIFKTDANMTRGGCLLESSNCTVDASIEQQLNNMKEFLENQPAFVAPPDNESMPPAGAQAEKTSSAA